MRTRRAGRDQLWPFAGFELVLVAFGFLAPIALLVAYAFGESDFLTFDVAVTGTLDPFRKLFSATYRPVLVRSFSLAMVTVLVCALIGTPAALAISRMAGRRSQFALLAVVAPAFVSFTVRVHAWGNLLGADGLVESITGRRLLFRPDGVAVAMVGTYLPLFILPVALALSRVHQSLLESGADLGASRWRTTRTIALPLARPGIVTGAVLVGVLSIGEYIVPAVLGGGRVLLIGNLLNDQAGGRDQPLGGAIAVVILVVTGVGALVARWRGSERAVTLDDPAPRTAGGHVGRLSGVFLGVTLLLLYAPIAQLVVSSLNSNSLTATWRGFTLDWYDLAVGNDEVVQAAWRSLRLAVSVAVAAGTIGTLGAIAVRHHPRSRRLLNATAIARIATPEIVLAVGLSVLMPLVGVQFGPLSIWFGHTVLLSAYVMVIVSTRLAGTSISLEEGAADLGASPLRVVRSVVLPHVLPAVAAAMVLVAAFSFDDVLLSSRLAGPNDTTLPVVILSMATRRPTPELDAIGTLVVIAGLASFVVALAVGRLRSGSTRDLLGGSAR